MYVYKKLLNCFLARPYHVTSPPATYEVSTSYFTSSSALGIDRVFFFNFGNSNRCGVVSHYISIFMYITLMTDGVGHLTMCSSAFIYPL